MALKFFGRGSGFTDNHTSAYFSTPDNELVIIDCPVTALQKLMKMNLDAYNSIYVLITHTHGDHIGGLGLFIQYAFFVSKKIITVVAPSDEVWEDLSKLFEIEGIDSASFIIISSDELKNKAWFKTSILTTHAPQLSGKCFGYRLTIDGENIVYSGDTSTLMPYFPHLTKDSTFFVDTSVHYGQVHLKLEDNLKRFLFLNEKGIKIFLMHLDDVEAAKKMVAEYDDINVVEIE